MSKNFDTLQIGQWYSNSLGAIVKIVARDVTTKYDSYPYISNAGNGYTESGIYDLNDVGSGHDLVSRVEPPIPVTLASEKKAVLKTVVRYMTYDYVKKMYGFSAYRNKNDMPLSENEIVIKLTGEHYVVE